MFVFDKYNQNNLHCKYLNFPEKSDCEAKRQDAEDRHLRWHKGQQTVKSPRYDQKLPEFTSLIQGSDSYFPCPHSQNGQMSYFPCPHSQNGQMSYFLCAERKILMPRDSGINVTFYSLQRWQEHRFLILFNLHQD